VRDLQVSQSLQPGSSTMQQRAAMRLWLLLVLLGHAAARLMSSTHDIAALAATVQSQATLQESAESEEADSDEDDEEEDDDGQAEDEAEQASEPKKAVQQPVQQAVQAARSIPDKLPSDFDAITFMASSEIAEENAMSAETTAADAEVRALRSSQRLQQARDTKAAAEAAAKKGRSADARENAAMATDRLHAAESATNTRINRAKTAMAAAKEARLVALQFNSKAVPGVKLNAPMTALIQSYGPASCVSTWRDQTSGHCILKTDCQSSTDFDKYDIGFQCKNSEDIVEHRFGSTFAADETRDTEVSCEKCLPPLDNPDMSAEVQQMQASLKQVTDQFQDLSKAAQGILRGSS